MFTFYLFSGSPTPGLFLHLSEVRRIARHDSYTVRFYKDGNSYTVSPAGFLLHKSAAFLLECSYCEPYARAYARGNLNFCQYFMGFAFPYQFSGEIIHKLAEILPRLWASYIRFYQVLMGFSSFLTEIRLTKPSFCLPQCVALWTDRHEICIARSGRENSAYTASRPSLSLHRIAALRDRPTLGETQGRGEDTLHPSKLETYWCSLHKMP